MLLGDGLRDVVGSLQLQHQFSKRGAATPNWYLFEDLYRTDWIAKKIVDIPALDMTRKPREWIGGDADRHKAFKVEWKRLKLSKKIQCGLQWSRLYGGAALYLDDGDDPAKPIWLNSLVQGGLKNVHVISRRHIQIPECFDKDLQGARFGEPEYFDVSGYRQGYTRAHGSRIIPIHGVAAPDTGLAEDYWGDGVLVAAYEAVGQASKSPKAVARMMENASFDYVEVEDLRAQTDTEDAKNRFLERWSLFNVQKSIQGLGILNKGKEEFKNRELKLASYDNLINVFMLIAAGAADIPATRMVGQSAVGLSATGEGDLRNYYDSIGSRQNSVLREIYDEIDSYVMMSVFGTVDPNFEYEFPPLWTLTEKEQAEIEKTEAEAIKIYAETDLVHREALNRSVNNKLKSSMLLPSFDHESEDLELEEHDLEIDPEQLKPSESAPASNSQEDTANHSGVLPWPVPNVQAS